MNHQLILIRHAKTEVGWDKKDFDRQLTSTGLAQIYPLSQWLKGVLKPIKLNINPSHWLVSSAIRTLQTAKLTLEALGLDEQCIQLTPSLYGASPEQTLNLITEQKYPVLVVVAHNPNVSQLGAWFKKTKSDTSPLRPSEAVSFMFDIPNWGECENAKPTSFKDYRLEV